MTSNQTKEIKQISPGKYLFFINGKEIYYLTFESKDMMNIEIILIKLNPKETYVYKTIIPFQKIGTNDPSIIDALSNLNFIIYNFDFSITDEFNKIILWLNSKSQVSIHLFLYNKNMENVENKKQLEKKNNLEKMQDKMKELINIIEMQNKKIIELKQKEESQIKLINKVDEVTKQITDQYKEIKNNSNNYNNANNNFNQNNNDINNNMYMRSRTNYNQNDSNNPNMNFNQNKKLSVNVNYVLNPYLPDNTNINNLLTRPQNMNPIPQQQPFQKVRSINLDQIPDYRH